jgi:hypothetical protein
MKTEYEFLKFVQLIGTGKTMKWSCQNKNSCAELGLVKWYGSWRQYCYFPTVRAVYSAGCLNDIAEFIKQLKQG